MLIVELLYALAIVGLAVYGFNSLYPMCNTFLSQTANRPSRSSGGRPR